MNHTNILVCDLEGTFAHFRKFYTNSSSLSYAFPPPTTIAGLVAGIMGIERDQYYSILSGKDFRSAVEICYPVRKLIQTVNYVFVTSLGDVNKVKGSTQVPFELVVGKKIDDNIYSKLRYRLYLTHRDKKIYTELKERLQNHTYVYPPYLGVTECTGKLTFVTEIFAEQLSIIPPGQLVTLDTVCNVDYIEKGSLELNFDKAVSYIKELVPVEFDETRLLTSSGSFVYEQEGKGITAKFNIPVIKLQVNGEEKNISWLQEVTSYENLFPY
ncbi:type I-B CRISPR-associated protein Cas5b [Thermotalea metallivorans]|uniref:CRISPR-associated protein Cas5 n=1 Tax=Thermotalea metallivorans TaxID=520762 RepID=A0A140L1D6_9FIRM|nr:type I-B CRISPR-associated protein Cas5b [Thermotalea metallivorans]KXG74361.1 hypothetical protein AN619_24120 [Thermotalea metallivorans]